MLIGTVSRRGHETGPIEQMTSSVPFQWNGSFLHTAAWLVATELTVARARRPWNDTTVATPTSVGLRRSSVCSCTYTQDHGAASEALATR